jgi:enoyl-CoA hydratase
MDFWSFAIEDQIAVVSPNEGAAKSLTLEAVAELSGVLTEVGALRSTVGVVVITGGDDGLFVGEVDRDEFALSVPGAGDDARDQADWYAWHRVGVLLESIPQPTVAAIDGVAAGGGYVLALNCTLRIASERAALGPAELSLGIVGTQSFSRLVRLIGPSLTAELLLTKRVVQADEARRIGLINDVLATEGFMEHVRRWCEPIPTVPNLFEIKRSIVDEDFVARSELWAQKPWNGPASVLLRDAPAPPMPAAPGNLTDLTVASPESADPGD